MYLGIDIGGTNLKFGILNDANELVYDSSIDTHAETGPDKLIERLIRKTSKINESYPDIKSIGIGVPGVVTPWGTVQIAPNLKGWVNINFKRRFERDIDIPTFIDNDAHTAALAELKLGAGIGKSHFIYVTLGTGVGGAFVIDGKIYHGESGAAAEIGHTIIGHGAKRPEKIYEVVVEPKEIDPSTITSENFRTGIIEELIGRHQMIRRTKEIIKEIGSSQLKDIDFDVKDISDAVNDGDLAAISAFKEFGENLGIALSSIMNILDISTVIVGGGVSNANELLLNTASETIRLRSLPNIADKASIIKAKYHKDAGIIGAALLGRISLEEYKNSI